MQIAIQVVAAGRAGEDRASAFAVAGGYVLVVADGAGGTTGGALAADHVIAAVSTAVLTTPEECVGLLRRLDSELTAVGQTTAVVVVAAGDKVMGASVGDSGACVFLSDVLRDLTAAQRRKPLLGSGSATPVGFGPLPYQGRLLLGSDGLFKYVPPERLRVLATSLPLADTPAALVAAARLPSGALQDDIAVLVAD